MDSNKPPESLLFDKLTFKQVLALCLTLLIASAGIATLWIILYGSKDDMTEDIESTHDKSENSLLETIKSDNQVAYSADSLLKESTESKEFKGPLEELSLKVAKGENNPLVMEKSEVQVAPPVEALPKTKLEVASTKESPKLVTESPRPETLAPKPEMAPPSSVKSENQMEPQGRTALTEHPNILKLSTCSSTNGAFCAAHLHFMNTLKAICEREQCSAENKANLNMSFLQAKALYDNSDELMTKVYASADASGAGEIIFDVRKININTELSNLVPAERNKSLRIVYDSIYRASLIGSKTLFQFEKLSLKDYDTERKTFIKSLYEKGLQTFFDKKLQSHLLAELEKPDPNLQPIVNWWLSYELKLESNNVIPFVNEFVARDVVEVQYAAKYALYKLVNKYISNWLNGNETQKNQAQQEYIRLRVAKYFNFPPTLPELISKYFTSSPRVLSVVDAVVDTPPKRLEFDMWCFASSYSQSMANFLPLFQKSAGWNKEKNGPVVENQKLVFSEVAKNDGKSINVRNLYSWPAREVIDNMSPLQMMTRFRSDAGASGLSLNQIFGMFYDEGPENTQYLPSYMVYPQIQPRYLIKLRMIGQLFVCYIPPIDDSFESTDPRFYHQVELPLAINFKVVDSDKPKRFELYSFIMAKHSSGRPHVVSYVRRATGQWYLCDDSGGNVGITDAELPTTIEKQKTLTPLQRPFMAFYLRVEQ